MAYLGTIPVWQVFDDNGDPLAGAKLYTYESGSSTPQETYTDIEETTPHTNPVVFDASGRQLIYFKNKPYKLVLTDSNDNIIWTVDKYTPSGGGGGGGSIGIVNSIEELRSLEEGEYDEVIVRSYYGDDIHPYGGGLFKWKEDEISADDGGIIIAPSSFPQTGRWVRDVRDPYVNIDWYGAKRDGSNNYMAIYNATRYATNNLLPIYIPSGIFYIEESNSSLFGTVKVVFEPGGMLSVGGGSVSMNPVIDIEDFTQHFSSNYGSYTITFPSGTVVRPEHFGAAGTGAVNDRHAIAFATDAIKNGGTVLYGKKYLVHSNDICTAEPASAVSVYSNQNHIGESGSVIYVCESPQSGNDYGVGFEYGVFGCSPTVSNVLFENLTFSIVENSIFNNSTAAGACIYIAGKDIRVNNCTFKDISSCVIFTSKTETYIPENIYIYNNRFSLSSWRTYYLVNIKYGNKIFIKNNTFVSYASVPCGQFIYADGSNTLVEISNNSIDGASISVLEGTKYLMQVTNNYINLWNGSNELPCILVSNTSGDMRISNNVIIVPFLSSGLIINITNAYIDIFSNTFILPAHATGQTVRNCLHISGVQTGKVTVNNNNFIAYTPPDNNNVSYGIYIDNYCLANYISVGVNNFVNFNVTQGQSNEIKCPFNIPIEITANAISTIGTNCTKDGSNFQILTRQLLSKHPLNIQAENEIALGNGGNFFLISGTTHIKGISGTNWTDGSIVVLQFTNQTQIYDSEPCLTGSLPIKLRNGCNRIISPNDVIVLVKDSYFWLEIAYTPASGEREMGGYATVASANNLTLPASKVVFLTGNTHVKYINTDGWKPGSIVYLLADGVLMRHLEPNPPSGYAQMFLVNMSGPGHITLGGGYVDVLQLLYDGTYWRSVNYYC